MESGRVRAMNREEARNRNIGIINETLGLINDERTLSESLRKSISSMEVCLDGAAPRSVAREEAECAVTVTSRRTREALYASEESHVALLDFASATRPGGGARTGASAQEEALCRISTLLPALESRKARRFYVHHHLGGSGVYSDSGIIVPGVVFFRSDDSDMAVLDKPRWRTADVIAVPAPNLKRIKADGGMAKDAYLKGFESRVDMVFRLALATGAEALILGAFGCGAFGNDAWTAASIFKNVQNRYLTRFRRIEYAVYDHMEGQPNLNAFRAALG